MPSPPPGPEQEGSACIRQDSSSKVKRKSLHENRERLLTANSKRCQDFPVLGNNFQHLSSHVQIVGPDVVEQAAVIAGALAGEQGFLPLSQKSGTARTPPRSAGNPCGTSTTGKTGETPDHHLDIAGRGGVESGTLTEARKGLGRTRAPCKTTGEEKPCHAHSSRESRVRTGHT